MKQVYCCDICGAMYSNGEDCKKCEEYHVGVKSLEAAMYQSKGAAQSPHPTIVLARMQDGALVRYVFDGVLENSPEISPQPVRFMVSSVEGET